MGISIEELQRAGLVETSNGVVEKKIYGKPTHIRSAKAVAGKADVQPDSSGASPQLECDTGDGALAALHVQKRTGRHFLVCIEAVRTRLLDDDNACEKYHVDLLRYAGVIPDDCPGTTRIQVTQQKAQAGEREEVRITVYET
ncbi:hypothetical protein [Caballeronia sp.]|uniref:hypothetical protein n=1 Tax=Caballeronia sp. TaxID=1931223 RepID=UPI003C3EF081